MQGASPDARMTRIAVGGLAHARPQERAASLARRDGGPVPIRRAVEWYRSHGRLHIGDAIATAADARTG